jgi:hypothetical protein
MRKTLLTAAAVGFILSTTGSGVALAQVSTGDVKSASEKKDAAAADAAGAKVDAKGAEKAANTAKKKSKTAQHKAKVAADKADTAAKASIDANSKP